MNLPTDNLTFDALSTLAGLALATWILVTALRQVIPTLPAKITALGLAVLLSLAVVILSGHASDPQALLLAVINGALAALIAAGGSLVTESLALRPTPTPSDPAVSPATSTPSIKSTPNPPPAWSSAWR